jgi:hypothetical protein
VDLNLNFTSLDDAALAEYAAEVRAAFVALAELETPTAAQVDEAEALADHLDALIAEQGNREQAAAALADRAAALRTRFAPEATETETEEEAEEEEEEEAEAEEPKGEVVEGEVVEVVDEPVPAAARSNVVALSKKVKRPVKPAPTFAPVVITAAADVPEFATGSKIPDMTEVGTALVNRMRGFGTPTGDGSSENLQHYGVASFRLDFPAELTIDRHSDDMEVLNLAARESRLPGGSLVAAGGWCAPSETIYDLCAGGSTDGILSLPEVNVARGGIKYTQGPDFSALYAAGFCQTEAQAIAGTTKPCYEVPCPSFTEVRLDVCGICIKVPILTNAAYPELVNAFLTEAMVAHQHAMNAKVLAALATSAGAAVTVTGLGSASGDTLEGLLLAAANMRQKYRLPMGQSLEVVLPHWAKDVLVADMFRRNGCCGEASDAAVSAIFSTAGVSVQYVYDWEELPADATAWPDVIPALVYPAGSYIKGTADVINLNAVYDAASLATNVYTGLFFEQGVLVAEMCRSGVALEIPVCTAGRTGAADLTCVTAP